VVFRAFNYWPDLRVFDFLNLVNSQKLNALKNFMSTELLYVTYPKVTRILQFLTAVPPHMDANLGVQLVFLPSPITCRQVSSAGSEKLTL